MMCELVSLIVPIYNGEKYIDEFYHMFRMQKYPNIELILVDDGSNDATVNMLDELAHNDERVVVYHKKNGGVSTARNLGIEKAKGQYIAFADIDDYIYPDYIQYMWQLAKRNNADIAFCSYVKMTAEESDKKQKNAKKSRVLFFNKEEAIQNFCYRKYLTGYSYLKLIKTSIAKDVFFDQNMAYGEDFIYSYELLKRSNKIVYGNEIQYVYVQNENSSTHVKCDNTLKYWTAWSKHLEFLKDVQIKFPDSYKGAVAKCYVLAINNTTRIYDKKRDVQFLEQLYAFIRQHSKMVAMDSCCKASNRLLGIMGIFNTRLLCYICKFILSSNVQFLLRRTV